MDALLGTSSFSEAFRMQIGLAALLSGCTRPSGNLESQTGAGRGPLWVKMRNTRPE
jgi:hypothetical protein